MEKKSIFEILNERNVTYAVGISYGLGFRTWFIIASSKHLKYRPKRNSPVFELGFEENSRDDTIERELSEKEVQEFKNMRYKFKMVHRDDSGTIYELKDRSLKYEVMLKQYIKTK